MTRPPIPTVESYRGVGLHDQQDEERLAVVRADVDGAYALASNVPALVAWAKDRSHAPESRLLAAALARAEYELAIDERRARPSLDREWLAAVTAGLGTTRNRFYYDSMFSALPIGSRAGESGHPVRRTQPLSG